jgi:hypothetical protein
MPISHHQLRVLDFHHGLLGSAPGSTIGDREGFCYPGGKRHLVLLEHTPDKKFATRAEDSQVVGFFVRVPTTGFCQVQVRSI